jgi:hypothetical protein
MKMQLHAGIDSTDQPYDRPCFFPYKEKWTAVRKGAVGRKWQDRETAGFGNRMVIQSVSRRFAKWTNQKLMTYVLVYTGYVT